jgi:2-oxoglutarate dehydrogenase E1 component
MPHPRSSRYATDVANLLRTPIIHVDGEDLAAAAQAVTLAMEFRGEFRTEVVIDMYCHRRHGPQRDG